MPVLSKQKVLIFAAYVVFSGSVPMILFILSLVNEKELDKLKKIGKLGGKLQFKKSKNLKTINIAITPFIFIIFMVHMYIIRPTVQASKRK